MADESRAMFTPPAEAPRNRKVIYAVAGVIVLALLIVVLAKTILNRPPAPETLKPLDATAASLKISNLALSEAGHGVGGTSLYVDGVITNQGPKALAGATVQVVFQAEDGSAVKLETVPLRLIRQKEPYVDFEPVNAEPVGPGQSHEFRLIFEGVPETWNVQPPQLRLVHIDWQ